MLAAIGAMAIILVQAPAPVPATLDPRWTVALASSPAAPPAYDADTAYVPLRDGSLLAVGLDRGAVLWQREIRTAIAPATGGGMVYVATDGHVEAMGTADGVTRWRAPLPGRIILVAWDNGWLLCGTDAGDLAALRALDGSLVWRADLGAPLVTPPAAGLDRLYLGLDGARVAALDLATGATVWERTLGGPITALSVTADQLIAGTSARGVVSLDIRNGRQRWHWRVGGAAIGAATSDERHIYFASRDNVVRAVDRGNGNLKWYAELSSRPVGGPVLFDGAVLVPLSTAIELLDPATGKAVGTIPAPGELSTPPHVRPEARATSATLVAITRDGHLQGAGARFEPPAVPLTTLPGTAVVP